MVDLRCAMEQADVSRLEADISIQLERPTNPDLIVAKLGRLHIYTFVSKAYRDALWRSGIAVRLKNHRISQATRRRSSTKPATRESWDWSSLEGVVGIIDKFQRRRFSTPSNAAPESDFCRRRRLRWARRWSPIDLGINYHVDLWLTYHKEFRNSDRHKIVIDWLKRYSIRRPMHASGTNSSIRTNSSP